MIEVNDSRPPKLFLIYYWCAGVMLAPLLFIFDLSQLDGLRLSDSKVMIGRDFFNVWTGGNLALSGHLNILYDFHGYQNWQQERFGPFGFYNYSYPPHSLFLATPFAVFPYAWSLLIWTVLGACFFLWAARPYMPKGLSPVYAVLTPAALVNIWAGHYGFVVGGLWLLFFSSLERQRIRGGVVAGLLTLKPHLGVLIAVVMLLRKQWLMIAVAVISTILIVLGSGLLFGFNLWREWLFETSVLQAKIMTAPDPQFYYLMMPSSYIVLRNMPYDLAVIVQSFFALIAIFLFWKCRNTTPKNLAFISATTTSLISPYIFNYDLTVASLGFFYFMYSYWGRTNRWEQLALWFAFASPLFVMGIGFLAPVSLLVGLYIQTRMVLIKDKKGLHAATSPQ